MKAIVVSFFALFSVQAQATAVCEFLTIQAETACEKSMCEEVVREGFECEKDGDFYEGFQICVYEELQDLVSAYNKENPKAALTCQE